MSKFYITTPIYYVNDVPHIGHTCTTVAADIVARFKRQRGEEVFFLTGTDEHGQKVEEEAKKQGLSPKEFCDQIAPRFKKAWEGLNISFDFFIRTTDPKHEAVVRKVLEKIYKNGDIYKGKYEGLYCLGCEKFLTEADKGRCPLHPPEKIVKKTEENWFFKLSKYEEKLKELIAGQNYIFPEGKRKEVLATLDQGLADISFTRERVDWGIKAPWDPSQTVYVWVDALLNYYSATRFVENKEDFWPADVHLVAKDILWFHTVIWQAMLLAAGIELPKKVFVHSFYMVDGQKMSKSLGNVISPEQLVDTFGIDGARFLVAMSFPRDNDSDISIDRFRERYNADLANNLGNLVSRLANLAEGLTVENTDAAEDKEFDQALNDFRFEEAISGVIDRYVNVVNTRLNQEEPWKLEANDPKRQEILHDCIRQVKQAAYLLEPVMPDSCKKINQVLTGKVKPLDKPLFPRIK